VGYLTASIVLFRVRQIAATLLVTMAVTAFIFYYPVLAALPLSANALQIRIDIANVITLSTRSLISQ
jgi:hypothetical protein